MVKKGLGSKGKGLDALLSTKLDEPTLQHAYELDINLIEPNRKQPRKHFDALALEELAASLRQYGMIQPVVVKKQGDYYELVAGERRWRAAKIAGLKKIPVFEKTWDEAVSFEAALVENLQRENLNPIEEAESFVRLQEEFSLNQEEIAKKVGKSRSAVANAMRLLQLDPRVLNFVREQRISSGHARALLSLEDGEKQFFLAEHILEEGCSVRETEALVKRELEAPLAEESIKTKKEGALPEGEKKALESDLHAIFSTKVKINQNKDKGKIEITYYSQEELDRLLTMMKRMEG